MARKMSNHSPGSASVILASWGAKTRYAARWVARYELVWLAAAAPLLLFAGWWTPLGLAVIALSWLSRWVASGRASRRTPMDGPIAVLLLMVGIGLSVSVSLAWSWSRAPVILLGVATYYGLVNSIRTERHLRILAIGLVLASLGYTLVGLLGTDWGMVRFVELPQVYRHIPRLIHYAAPGPNIAPSELLNPRQVAGALVVLFPIPLALLFFGHDQRLRFLSGLAALVMIGTLLLSQSIPGMIALGAVLLFLGVWRSRWFLLLIPLGIGVLGCGLLAYGPGRAALTLLSFDHPIGIGVVLRLDMWSRALAMIHDMPFTGVGLNGFVVIQNQFYPGFSLGREPHAHNLFLQTALDLGIPGFVAFLWLLAAFANTVVKTYRATTNRDLRALLVGLAASILSHLTYGLMDVTPWGSRTQVAFWAIMGAASAIYLTAARDASLPPLPRPIVSFKTMAVLLLAVVLAAFFIPAAPGAFYVNLATVQAQKALLQTRSAATPPVGALRSAEGSLERALLWQANNSHLYSLLGQVRGWLGDEERALEAFSRRVELDGQDPIARYAPFEALRRWIQGDAGQDRWDDTIRVYSQWMARFPERMEPYLLIAMVLCQHKQNSAQASQVLEAGLARAQPRGVLILYSSRIREVRCGAEP
ncbi:MAG: O-antigen ligase family protein [Anaerolineae bacterium]